MDLVVAFVIPIAILFGLTLLFMNNGVPQWVKDMDDETTVIGSLVALFLLIIWFFRPR